MGGRLCVGIPDAYYNAMSQRGTRLKADYIASYLNRRLNASSIRSNLYAEGFTSNKSSGFVCILSTTIEIGHGTCSCQKEKPNIGVIFHSGTHRELTFLQRYPSKPRKLANNDELAMLTLRFSDHMVTQDNKYYFLL